MPDLFASPEMVAGYARARPAVHPHVVERARLRLDGRAAGWALDVGCGAGLSTLPLLGIASRALGVEPVEAMVGETPLHAEGLFFAAGRAEAIPVRSGSIHLLAAAGSLNFVALDAFFAEAARVLHPDGTLLVYDFSAGRTFRDAPALDEWFTEFRLRYPRPVGVAKPLDPQTLAAAADGFDLVGREDFEVALPLDAERYCDYVMTETNVADAIQRGEEPSTIRAWCSAGLATVFGAREHDVVFPGYLALLRPVAPGSA
jgi:SAM-dependent methyltransferase